MGGKLEKVRIIWAEPLVELVADLRSRAATIRGEKPGDETAATLDKDANRIEAAIRKGAEVEWIDTAAAAEFLQIQEESVRARCRRRWASQGLARRRGGSGQWEINPVALAS